MPSFSTPQVFIVKFISLFFILQHSQQLLILDFCLLHREITNGSSSKRILPQKYWILSLFNKIQQELELYHMEFVHRLNFKLNQFDNVDSTRNAIKQLQNPRFGLSLHDGLRTVSKSLFIEDNGARIGVPRSLVVFTTGKASQPFTNELEKLKDTKIIAIGIGPDADMDDLDKLVENNDGKTFTVPGEGTDTDVDKLIKDITKETKTGTAVVRKIVFLHQV